MIISRTPFRVSFFGGGTDYPAWYREHDGGAVLATTIDKYCYISLRALAPFFEHRFRIVYSATELVNEIVDIRHPAVRAVLARYGVTTGLEIHHDGDLPARSGLGSSSAFTVGLINAMSAHEGRHLSKDALASEAIDVEQCVLREAVGVQDQISAAFGGFNHITIEPDGAFRVNPMVLPSERLEALQAHLMLVFTGVSRIAGDIAQMQLDNLAQRRAEMRAVRQMVDQAIEILMSRTSDIVEFGRLLHETGRRARQGARFCAAPSARLGAALGSGSCVDVDVRVVSGPRRRPAPMRRPAPLYSGPSSAITAKFRRRLKGHQCRFW